MPDAAELLGREARSLVERLRLWTPQRWAASSGRTAPPYGTRADLAHHLAQSFVTAAGETDRALPRLDSDLALPDQLAVTADDLARSGRTTLQHVAHLLAHRRDLLGEDVPASLLAQLAGVPLECSS
ncbi:MAG: hypothetical protein QOI82_1409 [Actinomycetota bacterium]|nr:hypothetical protein [Actinomycetota bacterium]